MFEWGLLSAGETYGEGNFSGGAILLGGYYRRWQLFGGQLSGRQFSSGAIIFRGNCLEGNYPGDNYPGENYPGGNCTGSDFPEGQLS